MATTTSTLCPWCKAGRIVLHPPSEPWVTISETDGTERHPAGSQRRRFRTAPVEWTSCTACPMTATRAGLEAILRGRVDGGEAPAVRRGSFAGPPVGP